MLYRWTLKNWPEGASSMRGHPPTHTGETRGGGLGLPPPPGPDAYELLKTPSHRLVIGVSTVELCRWKKRDLDICGSSKTGKARPPFAPPSLESGGGEPAPCPPPPTVPTPMSWGWWTNAKLSKHPLSLHDARSRPFNRVHAMLDRAMPRLYVVRFSATARALQYRHRCIYNHRTSCQNTTCPRHSITSNVHCM